MRNKSIFTILNIFISITALYFAFRNVPFSELIDYAADISIIWFIPFIMMVMLAFTLRIIRWKTILGAEHHLTFWQTYHPLTIAFMVNLILPGRVGELVRPILLKQKESIPFTTGFASVVAERLFDLLFLLILFIVTSNSIQIDPGLSIPFGEYHLDKSTLESIRNGVTAIFILILTGTLCLSNNSIRSSLTQTINKASQICDFLPQSARIKIEHLANLAIKLIDNIATGLLFLKKPKHLALCLILSFLIWTIQALSYYVLAKGCPGIDSTFLELAGVMTIICFFIALPSVPGYWGVWEAGGVFAFSLLGVSGKDAAGYTLVNHVLQVIPIILAGIVSAQIYGIKTFDFSHKNELVSSKKKT